MALTPKPSFGPSVNQSPSFHLSVILFLVRPRKVTFINRKESLGDSTGEPLLSYFKKELKLQHFRVVSNYIYIYISFFLAFTETYDLATLVDNPTQLPRHYRRMSLYISRKFQPKIFVPISARRVFIWQGIYECHNRSNLPLVDDCYMLLLTCSRILEYFNASSSSSLTTRTEMRLWLFLQILTVEVQWCRRRILDGRYCVRSDTELMDQQ